MVEVWIAASTYSTAVANNWILKDSSGNYVHYKGTSIVLLDIGSTSFQQRFIADIDADLRTHPGLDGLWLDDVTGSLFTGTPISTKYPTNASYRAAMISFMNAVGPALRAKGWFVAVNASILDGAIESTTGPALGRQPVHLVDPADRRRHRRESRWSTGSRTGTAAPRSGTSGSTEYQAWDGWQRLVSAIQGLGKQFYPIGWGSLTDGTKSSYLKGSFLLDWNGGQSAFTYSSNYSSTSNHGTQRGPQTSDSQAPRSSRSASAGDATTPAARRSQPQPLDLADIRPRRDLPDAERDFHFSGHPFSGNGDDSSRAVLDSNDDDDDDDASTTTPVTTTTTPTTSTTTPVTTTTTPTTTTDADADAAAGLDLLRTRERAVRIHGTLEVHYGANGKFTSPRTFTGGVDCNNTVFGDPTHQCGQVVRNTTGRHDDNDNNDYDYDYDDDTGYNHDYADDDDADADAQPGWTYCAPEKIAVRIHGHAPSPLRSQRQVHQPQSLYRWRGLQQHRLRRPALHGGQVVRDETGSDPATRVDFLQPRKRPVRIHRHTRSPLRSQRQVHQPENLYRWRGLQQHRLRRPALHGGQVVRNTTGHNDNLDDGCIYGCTGDRDLHSPQYKSAHDFGSRPRGQDP